MCRTGCPCGRTCISCLDTCHIDSDAGTNDASARDGSVDGRCRTGFVEYLCNSPDGWVCVPAPNAPWTVVVQTVGGRNSNAPPTARVCLTAGATDQCGSSFVLAQYATEVNDTFGGFAGRDLEGATFRVETAADGGFVRNCEPSTSARFSTIHWAEFFCSFEHIGMEVGIGPHQFACRVPGESSDEWSVTANLLPAP
jgi:hypothetical protein